MNNFSDSNDKYNNLIISNDSTKICYSYDRIIKEILLKKGLIKKISNKIGLLLISIKGMILFLSLVLSFILKFIWGSKGNLNDYAIAYYLGSGFLLTFSILFPMFLILRYKELNSSVSKVLLFNKLDRNYMIALFFFGISICMIANILTYIFTMFMSVFGVELSNPSEIYSNSPLSIFLMIFTNSVIPAIFEEFLFRGVILGAFRRFGDFFAILISSILFSTMHNSLIQIPFSLIVGLALGFIVVKTTSLIPAILIHFGNNFISCLMEIVSHNVNESLGNLTFIVLICCLIILGIFSMLYLGQYTNFFEVWGHYGKLSLKDKMICFISSPTIIIFIILDILVLSFV